MCQSILIVSATKIECEPTLNKLCDIKTISSNLFSGIIQGQSVEVLISGIGSVSTTFRLTQTLMQRSYCGVISIGIAGSFAQGVEICETVQIIEDCFADLGVDDNGQFRTLHEERLTYGDYDHGFMNNTTPVVSSHRRLRGITVQTSSGSNQRIEELVERFQPDVETMENAAFFYVCNKMNVPFASFRAISNKVEARNRHKWRVEQAIANVNEIEFGNLFRLSTQKVCCTN